MARMGMRKEKRIALIAHDQRKKDLIEWASWNKDNLKKHKLFATGTTGRILTEKLGLEVASFQSGPLGGDSQIGSRIVEGQIDMLIFFWDPLENMPHDPDVRALLRLAVVWNIPVACNRSSADFIFSSPLMNESYERIISDYGEYSTKRKIDF